MTSEISYIKNIQREFKSKFGKDLPIDFPALKGAAPSLKYSGRKKLVLLNDEEMFDRVMEIIDKYGASLEIIRNKRIWITRQPREHSAMTEICKTAVEEMWVFSQLAEILNKHRSVVYHYAAL
jgi:hypothetical protein